MSTSTLELVELDVNLDEEVSCSAHPTAKATHRLLHPGAQHFMCATCTRQTKHFLEVYARWDVQCRLCSWEGLRKAISIYPL